MAGDAGTAEGMSPVVLGEAVLWALSALSTPAGTLVVLEDLQWANPDTLATVGYLADHLGGSALLAIVTVQTTGRDHAAGNRALARHPPRHHGGALDRLDAASVAQLVAQRLRRNPPVDLIRTVEERSGGVPSIIEELLAAGEEVATVAVPGSLAGSVD